MADIDITDVSSHTCVTVTVNLGNGPVMPVNYLNRDMVADWVKAEYQYDSARGWWFAVSVTVAGQRVLKPGPDGTQRLGKDRHKSTYGGWSRDIQEAYDLPGWLDQIVSELRPSGELSLPGM